MVTLLHPLNLEGPLLTALEHLTNNVAQTKLGVTSRLSYSPENVL